ncbi:imidazole glycerol phosphate synthase [Tribonema minus]|uniref:Imidazole glycerol phosphate synthase hisHF n=1 Tax=Tribonema minus TaxID=303371 RepID=A0A835ZC23_9STRA|nr:imidazole glycerol phosphate synthase [Tribonema minus]
MTADKVTVSLLDYGAGNVRSVRNAITSLGYAIKDVATPGDIDAAEVIIFPGVGSFGNAMDTLEGKGYTEPLKAYLAANRPFFGICLGMQTLFESSEESPEHKGLGIIPGAVTQFDSSQVSVPHIGWNGAIQHRRSHVIDSLDKDDVVYFVHSYRALPTAANKDWVLSTTTYGEPGASEFISAVQKGNVVACQFHPEKSGGVGLKLLESFLKDRGVDGGSQAPVPVAEGVRTVLRKRLVACLDVRTNDAGDLVVTKGDQYAVREEATDGQTKGVVRNLGKPVELSERYYREGADEITFLNITSFRQEVLDDAPMLQVLEKASEKIFVPLTVGGGIRAYTDGNGRHYSALEVAARYFRAGADKISLGSDAVYAAEAYMKDAQLSGTSAIEQISKVYGRQAVVISVDPRRVYVASPEEAPTHTCLHLPHAPGPEGQQYAWYQCTVRGGREGRDVDAVQLVRACEALGAGEILLNCIDMDGQKQGFDLALVKSVMAAVSIPVIASSGAGAVEHFSQVFKETNVQAALAAGIFHKHLVEISDVKKHLTEQGIAARVVGVVDTPCASDTRL